MSTNIVVIGMGYVGIPMAVLLADVDDFYVKKNEKEYYRLFENKVIRYWLW